ncbi:DNA-3-methyladenine glycosylase family protein [Kribbella italica]|uniref:DNA-3-methyladenine glycosylase II n=1 Tax=Kribbella italica TaxID=1540520 RepID=A0A7W9MZ53_9ACTN|nr:DNA-3-methyladenine glycosylase 2 family protein [Kribbella italica]MBB5840858.1 DNA-3-methyladenine glycosylase II [Kribbella italica]
MTSSEHQLTAAAPFDFGLSLRFVGGFSPTAGEQQVGSGRLVKALRVGGETVLAEVSAQGSAVDVRLTGARGDAAVEAALDRIRFFLSLDDELEDFYALADDAFRPVVERLYGYHQVKFSSPWENVAWAILSQRTPRAVAVQAKAALIERTGNLFEADGIVYPAFPDAEQVAALDDLAEVIGNVRKAGYLQGAARRWLDLSETELREAPYEEAKEQLLSLPGIGPWSSMFVLIRGLGRMDEMPTEKEFLRAAARVYGRALDEKELIQLSERYGPWRGYWAHYLRADG